MRIKHTLKRIIFNIFIFIADELAMNEWRYGNLEELPSHRIERLMGKR